jgi:hypothetical protein
VPPLARQGCEARRRCLASAPITASAIVATIGEVSTLASAPHVAAPLGPVPTQHRTGGTPRQRSIFKLGDRPLRRLLAFGATPLIRHTRIKARQASLANPIYRKSMVAACLWASSREPRDQPGHMPAPDRATDRHFPPGSTQARLHAAFQACESPAVGAGEEKAFRAHPPGGRFGAASGTGPSSWPAPQHGGTG